MKRLANICSIAALLGLAYGCAKPPAQAPEEASPEPVTTTDARGFDPLELPRDRVVVPSSTPRSGEIIGQQALVESDATEEEDTTGAMVVVPQQTIDSVNSQAYRVQLHTSRVYGEAKAAARVAEEIFDQPVYVDYEVPNYKVRVGSFADRDKAIEYQQRARAAGYTNAWVVMVKVAVKEVAPLYEGSELPMMYPPETPADTVVAPVEVEDDGDTED